jgi:DNA ligase-associated metallophosphoesterase
MPEQDQHPPLPPEACSRAPLALFWAGQPWWADPSGALWWPACKTLLMADLHLGKVGHFRKAGVPLPQGAMGRDTRLLDELIWSYKPDNLLVLGDLFHSYYNLELEHFRRWRKRHSRLGLQLVRGNHDVLEPEVLTSLGVEDLGLRWRVGELELVHNPAEGPGEGGETLPDDGAPYVLGGHIHPGIRLRGAGRQSLVLPCFWFGPRRAVLPAFGALSGLGIVNPGPGDTVLALAENSLHAINAGT